MNTKPYTPERRPLGARNWNASRMASAWLARCGVEPNAISIAGLFASLGACVAFVASGKGVRPAPFLVCACLLIVVRGMCNMLDGMVAVSTGRASPVGELYNEVPDRVSDATTLVGAGYAIGGIPELGYFAALAAIFTAYVRVQGCLLGTRADFCGPMAKTHRMFAVISAALYTALAPASWQLSVAMFPRAGALALALAAVVVGCIVTSVRRLRHTATVLREGRP